MDVLTGVGKQLFIKGTVFDKICETLGNNACETGGVIGFVGDTISEFEFDKYSSHELYEYYPNTVFFEKIINDKWEEKNVSFAGIVHSHLYNSAISNQDITYCREIINANSLFDKMILGILDISASHKLVKWYLISEDAVEEQKITVV